MKHFKHLIKSLRVEIVSLFGVAVATVLLIDFYLIDVPQLFRGGHKIGQVVYKLSMSYISAFIFYFLIVHMKQQKDKATVYPFVKLMAQRIVGRAINTLAYMSQEAEVQLVEQFPSNKELLEILERIHPYNDAPLMLSSAVIRKANWIELLLNNKDDTNRIMQKVFTSLMFIDAELVNILAKIENNSHFNQLTMVASGPMQNTNLDFLKSGLVDYFDLINQLQQYTNTKLSRYS